MISHLGAMIPVVVGKLLAKRMNGEKGFVGLTMIGEGGMQTGATHEGMNIAAVEKVPFVLVASNNHFAYSTPNDREFACAHLVDRAAGYGYEGHDSRRHRSGRLPRGHRRRGETRARRRPAAIGRRPLLRLAGHGEHDDASYVPPEMKKEPLGAGLCRAHRAVDPQEQLARCRNAQAMARGNFRRGREGGRDGPARSGAGRERRRLVRDVDARIGGSGGGMTNCE